MTEEQKKVGTEEIKNVSVEEINGEKGISIKTKGKLEIAKEKIDPSVKPIKILWYSDFLRHTGFGNVSEAIISRLMKTGRYHIEVLGINHNGHPHNIPESDYYHLKDIPVWPAADFNQPNSMMGYKKLEHLLKTRNFDIFFALQDTFNMINVKTPIQAIKKEKRFRYVFYFPIDGDIHSEWVDDGVKVADYPIVYTEYGKKQLQKADPSVNPQIIYHGADLEIFKPFATEEERQQFRDYYYFNIDDNMSKENKDKFKDAFIIANINRNQPRKDLIRTILAFVEFKKKYPEIHSKLYLHALAKDSAGNDLYSFIKKYSPCEYHDDFIMPNDEAFGYNGFPTELLVKIYAGADILTSTTLGEGWGLSCTEAMACKTPVVMPRNTSLVEIIGKDEERGYLVKSGIDKSMYNVIRFDNEILRPMTDINDLVEKWAHVYKNREEAKIKAEKAYKWLEENHTWDKKVAEWDELFQRVYRAL